ncbi:SprT family zinc-dependent metalloprotease [Gymnodinialimonas sp. 2305UL16-5]|uniref:M48 family metallopeptidase n=1 Tax=Gymnodinialimonas mytili TaxID=3126503 RepID=UPI0030B096F6
MRSSAIVLLDCQTSLEVHVAPHSSVSTHILPGEPPVEVILRRNARAKRFSLRVSRSDGRVSLSLPVWAPEAEAVAFLRAREDWVRDHLQDAPSVQRARVGAAIPICGVPRDVVAGTGRSARFVGGLIQVPPGPREGPRIKALLTAMARDRLSDAVTRYADQLGRAPGRMTLRDPRSRWGSCSSKGDLMFSWRLIMAPPEALEYVAAHEVAHLAEMNHSDRFWSLCRRLYPETDRQRAWFRSHGADLLAWRFEAEE